MSLKYLDYDLTNLNIDVTTVGDAIEYAIIIEDVDSPQLQLFHTEITGKITDNVIFYELQIDDSKGEPHYRIAGDLEAVEGNQRISLEVENLLLNYDKWQIPDNNSITFGPGGIQATNFNLSHQGNAIRINSTTDDPSSPLEVEFESFQLETISAMISKDTLLAAGALNGQVVIEDLTAAPQYEADLNISNFSFKQDTVGDVGIKVNNETVNSLQAVVTITGQGNDAELAGNYNTETGALDFLFDLERLEIESIQGFSMGSINDGTGYLSGDLKIEGTMGELSSYWGPVISRGGLQGYHSQQLF
ncbi:hypothetical protein LZ575_00745 [Antarcticibacterium sp. 1MA-6-2]|uniref:hypothetical protein n=1 Tax=Antarcticibacterium sp. 1MA-6-2 TaxID=2908210 RepID=UPI001F163E50|nr:hypothetical protein [Antarcticibacterium sp. 1MA-6-2]UJH91358.1 hypothetical protein LZ575_00745 [Antarcticibacterium sp. 1MA-6-2]